MCIYKYGVRSFSQYLSDAADPKTRNYRAERLKFYGGSTPTANQLKNRSKKVSRTVIRNRANRQGRTKIGDGKDIDHKDGNALNNAAANLRVMDRSRNRGRNNNK